MRVGLVAVEGCFSSGIVLMLDVLGTADATRSEIDPSIPPIEVELVGARRRITTSSGAILPIAAPLSELDGYDVVIVGPFGALTFDQTLAGLASRDGRAVTAAVRSTSPDQALAAACTGTFILGEAGVLDGGRATTSWWLGAAFRNRYPDVALDLDAMVVLDSRATTAGAAFAHVDLALTLLRGVSAQLAEAMARLLVIDPRVSQSSYIAVEHIRHNDALVLAFEDHVRDHLGDPLDIASVARAIGTSRRTLERRVSTALGLSPVAVVQRLRVERASHLRRTTDQSSDQIASLVGYANASTLRTLMRRLG